MANFGICQGRPPEYFLRANNLYIYNIFLYNNFLSFRDFYFIISSFNVVFSIILCRPASLSELSNYLLTESSSGDG